MGVIKYKSRLTLKEKLMNYLTETYTLNNGVKIPKVAFGTWQIPNENVYQATLDALNVGYRHIDTAKSYQ